MSEFTTHLFSYYVVIQPSSEQSYNRKYIQIYVEAILTSMLTSVTIAHYLFMPFITNYIVISTNLFFLVFKVFSNIKFKITSSLRSQENMPVTLANTCGLHPVLGVVGLLKILDKLLLNRVDLAQALRYIKSLIQNASIFKLKAFVCKLE